MITKNEIDLKSKELEISTADIQRDYIFGWLLNYIFVQSSLKEDLFLKGGNALRKGYFINTRFSSDLDFGTPHDITKELIEIEIEKACVYISEKTGVNFVFERNSVETKFQEYNENRWEVIAVKIFFKDFYGNNNHITLRISLDITKFDKPYLEIQSRELIHPYHDHTEVACKIRCAKLEEILATKLKCILQRDRPTDLFDYIYGIYLNKEIPINRSELLDVFLKKTIFRKNPSIARNILLKLPFEYMKVLWIKTIVCTRESWVDFEDALEKFSDDVKSLFSDYPETSHYDKFYFEPEMRNAIFRASKNQVLLKIIYKGDERFVEPYSLKFQQKKDGQEYEYLNAYKVSGGKSDPGIKKFKPDQMEYVECTEIKFIPRYEIEICKASEYPENRLLYDPAKQKITRPKEIKGTVTNKTTRKKSFGPNYIYKCSSCGKQFTRKYNNSRLKPHKNKSGYLCYGYGIYHGMKY